MARYIVDVGRTTTGITIWQAQRSYGESITFHVFMLLQFQNGSTRRVYLNLHDREKLCENVNSDILLTGNYRLLKKATQFFCRGIDVPVDTPPLPHPINELDEDWIFRDRWIDLTDKHKNNIKDKEKK